MLIIDTMLSRNILVFLKALEEVTIVMFLVVLIKIALVPSRLGFVEV